MLLPRPEHGVVAAESPGSGPGYWSGAPCAAAGDDGIFLAYRLRRPIGQGRGYAVAVAHSADGERFETLLTIGKEAMATESLERPALVRTPEGRWRLYLSCATSGTKHWRVEMTEAAHPGEFDAGRREVILPGDAKTGVKDPVIRHHDGQWHLWASCHPLADPLQTDQMTTEYATSSDGLAWTWHGTALSGTPGGWDARGTRVTSVGFGEGVAGRSRGEQRLVVRPAPDVLPVGQRVPGAALGRGRPVGQEELRLLDGGHVEPGVFGQRGVQGRGAGLGGADDQEVGHRHGASRGSSVSIFSIRIVGYYLHGYRYPFDCDPCRDEEPAGEEPGARIRRGPRGRLPPSANRETRCLRHAPFGPKELDLYHHWLVLLAGGGQQEREGDQSGQGAQEPGDDVRGAQPGGVRHEAAGQGAERHEAPAQHAVDAVHPAEQVTGDDPLAQADRDHVPHGYGESLDGQQRRHHDRAGREPDADERGGVDKRREDQAGEHSHPAGQDRVHQPAGHAAHGGGGQQEPVAARADVQRLGGQQDQDGLAHLVGEVVDAEQDGDHAEQGVPGQPA